MRWARLVVGLGLLASACQPAVAPEPVPEALGSHGAPAVQAGALQVGDCDAGDEAFVKRLVPLLWGRRPASIREVEVLVGVLTQTDRATLVRAMARSPEFRARWAHFLKDFLGVNRAAFRANPACYGEPLLPTVGSELAGHVAAHEPAGPPYPEAWNMTDLIHSALMLGDLRPVLRAQLFAQHSTAVITMQEELSFRDTFAGVFQRAYLNRKLECMSCHNSEWSITDSPDPAADRAWPLPGHFEEALFGSSGGMPRSKLDGMFRVAGVLALIEIPAKDVGDYDLVLGPGEAPWGVDFWCGQFIGQNDVAVDHDFTQTGHFAEDHDRRGSVWDVEELLQLGYLELTAVGLQIADDGAVDPAPAFAYLTAASLADAVWQEVMGRRLTIATTIPRNRDQRDTLESLVETVIGNGFALEELLVDITTRPTFNLASPSECQLDGTAYFLPPVLDPWMKEAEVLEERNNSVGDAVHPVAPRVLQDAVVYAMGWQRPNEFYVAPNYVDQKGFQLGPEAQFQRDIGIFLKDTEPGFRGAELLSTLTWEYGYGACVDPGDFSDVAARIADPPPDFIDDLLAAAPAGATLEDAVAALKDRLLTDPDLGDAEERTLVEALLRAPLTQPLAGDAEAEARLRRVCGALLAAPQLTLAGDVGPDRVGAAPLAIVVGGLSFQSLCEQLAPLLFAEGAMQCGASEVTVTP